MASGVKLTPSAARRVIKAARYVEDQARTRAHRAAAPRDLGAAVFLGVTTTAVTVRTSFQCGSGMVQPYLLDPSTGLLSSIGSPRKVWNWTGSTVASNVWVKFDVVNGGLVFDGNDCSGVQYY